MYMTRGVDVHRTFHSQIRIGQSSTNYLCCVPCRIEKKRRRRGQLRERWLTIHRCGQRARHAIPVEAKFPIECSVPRRTRTGKRVAGHEIHDLPLATVIPIDIVSSVRDKIPSPSASRANTTSTPLDEIASCAISSGVTTTGTTGVSPAAGNCITGTTGVPPVEGGGMRNFAPPRMTQNAETATNATILATAREHRTA